ncbi:MAG TPA: hypothetical protein VNA20_11245, partial [Frankiaceae bacterium]|nr:hypothetical protein [Frankiaceae bacterium]
MIQSVSLAGDYDRTHRVYAAGVRAGCAPSSGRCALLLTTSDGAVRWTAAAAARWEGGDIATARHAGRDVLLASAPGGVQVSNDGGASFGAARGPVGRIVVTDPDAPDVAVSSAGPALYRVGEGTARTYAPFDLRNPTFVLSPAYAAPRGPAALVSGTDPQTGFPVVERCDAAFTCGQRVVLLPKKDVPRLFLSPRFDSDGVVVATTVSGTTWLSRDHGATFTPVTVQRPGPDAAVTTVQSVAFTPDFDGRRGTGAVYAAVLSVRNDASAAATVHGGVYRATDPGGAWTKFGGRSRLDTGATAVVAAPDGRVYAAYLDARRGRAGVLCARGARWGSGCAFPRAARRPAGGAPSTAAVPGRP